MNRSKSFPVLFVLVVIVLTMAVGCGKKSSTSSRTIPPRETGSPTTTSHKTVSVPPFQVNNTRDVSLYHCVRIIADVVVRKTGPLTDKQLIEIARIVVNDITSSKRVNAIGVFFYHSAEDIGLGADASVDWAPHGQWGEACTIPTGDYSEHAYSVDFNST